jgi:DNA modification methylase
MMMATSSSDLGVEAVVEDLIKDSSVDLIVTDPPYLRKNLALFDGLANFATRKLKEGGSLVFYYGQYQEPEVFKIFSKYEGEGEGGLTYWWRFCVIHEGTRSTRMHSKGVLVSWKPMLWFVKGTKKLGVRDVHDVIYSTRPDKKTHPWAQSSTEAEYLIKNLTVSEDSLVVDPFLGSGAFAIPAIKLNRWFIGIELDKQVFEAAKNNIIISTSEEGSVNLRQDYS